jgi:hypothetical protein
MRRVMKPAVRVALGFTAYSGQPNRGMMEILMAAGFTKVNVMKREKWFCALALKP